MREVDSSNKKEILDWLVEASSHNLQTTDSDLQWAGEVIEKACSEVKKFSPTFFMRDFKPTNMVVEKINGRWQVTGLFDLMESSFGHPEADISIENIHFLKEAIDKISN